MLIEIFKAVNRLQANTSMVFLSLNVLYLIVCTEENEENKKNHQKKLEVDKKTSFFTNSVSWNMMLFAHTTLNIVFHCIIVQCNTMY